MELKYPIKSKDGSTITDITIKRRPKVRDLYRVREHSDNEARQAAFLVAILSDNTPEDIEEMDAADFAAISKEVTSFLL